MNHLWSPAISILIARTETSETIQGVGHRPTPPLRQMIRYDPALIRAERFLPGQ
jgi:hypothetical protein